MLVAILMIAKVASTRGAEDEERLLRNREEVNSLDFIMFWIVMPMIVVLTFILWRQKREAERRLREMEEMKKQQEEQKRIEKHVEAILDAKLKERRQEEEERRGPSQAAREVRNEVMNEVRRRSAASSSSRAADDEVTGGTPGLPNLNFPSDAVSLYVSPSGEKYHYDRQCRGLQHATQVILVARCPNCGPVQRKPQMALYRSPGGDFHTMRSHAEVVGQECKAYEACLLCQRA